MNFLKILFIEPYDGGSHRAFREGLLNHSRHVIDCLTLPPRFWKWRMRGAAVHFADLINRSDREVCDLIVATDFLNLADFKGLLRPPWDRIPTLLYFHENQLTYPLSPAEEFDFHFGFTNIISALAADWLVFNSDYHQDLFLDSLPAYLARMPEAVPKGVRQRLAAKSSVLPVGLEREPHSATAFAPYLGAPCVTAASPAWPRDGKLPTLLWNHRWEFDKRPDMFASVMDRLSQEGVSYQLLLLGDPRGHMEQFATLRRRLGSRCLAYGHVPERSQYERWMRRADIVVSCAEQEYFGIAVAEAVHAGAYAVLPRRQVYPSLYGQHCRGPHFYDDEDGLLDLLRQLLTSEECGHVCSLPLDCDRFCWSRLVATYDDLFQRVANRER